MNSSSLPSVNTSRVFAVTAVIGAPATELYDLLSDPSRHALIDGSGTVAGGVAPTELHVGDSFNMPMRLGVKYVTRNEVVEAKRPTLIAWKTLAPEPADKVVTGRTWRYEFLDIGVDEQHSERTLVRHSCDASTEKMLTVPVVMSMRTKILQNMARTVANMAVAVNAPLEPVRSAGAVEPLEDIAAGLPS